MRCRGAIAWALAAGLMLPACGGTTDRFRRGAAATLRCDEDAVEIEELPNGVRQVTGCGGAALYQRTGSRWACLSCQCQAFLTVTGTRCVHGAR